MAVKHGKIVIIGAGHVGASVLNAVLRMNIANDIAVINRNQDRAAGVVLDASHTTAFAYSANARIYVGTYDDCADAQLIFMTAGATIHPGGSLDRMTVLKENVAMMRQVMAEITARTRDAILINLSNPMDILVWIACREFDYPRQRVIGTGTLLDTARFNKMLGDQCGVDAKNVVGFVLGEHGPHAFIPWNCVNIVGIGVDVFQRQFGLEKPIDREAVLREVRTIGPEIVRLKGYTNLGVALSACRIAALILHDEKGVVPVSTLLDGTYGVHDVAMSMPCVISANGIDRVLEIPLDDEAWSAFRENVDYLSGVIRGLEP